MDNRGNDDTIIVPRVTLVWTVQNVIDVNDQMTFKVILLIQWNLSLVGAIKIPRIRGEKRK